MKKISFLQTAEFRAWYFAQTGKARAQIDGRLHRICEFGHWGHLKRLSLLLFEIKFNNGNRIYCTKQNVDDAVWILIFGGNKNGQSKDIKKAQETAEKVQSGRRN